jgi:hypothetical protein
MARTYQHGNTGYFFRLLYFWIHILLLRQSTLTFLTNTLPQSSVLKDLSPSRCQSPLRQLLHETGKSRSPAHISIKFGLSYCHPDWGFSLLATLTEVSLCLLPWLRFFCDCYPDWGFPCLPPWRRFSRACYPDWGFPCLPPWLRFFCACYPDWGFSVLATLTEVFLCLLPWLRFFCACHPDWDFSVFATLTEVFRACHPDWGFSVLATLTEVFHACYPYWGFPCLLPWLRFSVLVTLTEVFCACHPDWGFSVLATLTEVFHACYPDWGFPCLLPWLRFFCACYPYWGFPCLLSWLRFFCAFSSDVRQMTGYTSQRRGTVHILPNYWTVLFYVLFLSIVLLSVLFVCICVLYYCHRVSTQLQLTNISYHIKLKTEVACPSNLKHTGSKPRSIQS